MVTDNRKSNFLLGALGSLLGGTLWAFLSAFVIPSASMMILTCLFLAIGGYAVYLGWKVFPERSHSVMGILLLWLVIGNLVLVNLYYDQIPAMVAGFPTNVDNIDAAYLNLALVAFSFLGFCMILQDLKKT